jgi:hypothetical protein
MDQTSGAGHDEISHQFNPPWRQTLSELIRGRRQSADALIGGPTVSFGLILLGHGRSKIDFG